MKKERKNVQCCKKSYFFERRTLVAVMKFRIELFMFSIFVNNFLVLFNSIILFKKEKRILRQNIIFISLKKSTIALPYIKKY